MIGQKYYEEGMPAKVKEKDEEALRVLQAAFPDRRSSSNLVYGESNK
ncbi:hypothetical protein [Paenibacillus aquistagni]|nr:hypothetical protein [Paenibacillus aquistagni]